ncbi:enolase [Nitratireductor aestuarii]|uniref:Enolase n=1 Tax=Nitratireductor aestuarii TaxID=1735103 RepID=A0A916W4G4_9HYPH|nr:mandelate racemase/muconate lactonizing enzyme family protein [Nitratireductor aestuarii]GGA66847.1 enolase [Nitratireductor aestuarii]
MSSDLVIASAAAFHLAIPSVYGGPQPRDAQWPFINLVLVKVETAGGIVGWGEAFGHNASATSKAAFDTMVAPLVIGTDASDIAGLGAKLRRMMFTYGLEGPLGFALSGLDIALWDIRGKAEGKPVHQLLEPSSQPGSVPAYASLLRYGDPGMAGEAVADAVARGHGAVKLHEATVEAVAAAREAVGPDLPLTLDVNCRWSVEESIANARALRAHNLDWLEEPCWPAQPEHLARIARETGVPMAAGENAGSLAGLKQLASVGKVAYIQPSAAKIGGLSGLLEAKRIAERNRVRLATHSAYFGPALAATLQFCAANHSECEWYDCRLEAWPAGIAPSDGMLEVPNTPGLGVVIDEALIRTYQVK